MNDPDEPLNSVSKIDRISRYFGKKIFLKILFCLIFRVVFPMSYFIINIFYWNYYLGTQETVDTTVESYAL